MGFVQRAFTPPGTGDMSAVVAQQTAAAQAQQALTAAKQMPAAPLAPTLPAAAQAKQFMPGQGPGDKLKSQQTAKSLLGVAATTGQTASAQATGGQRRQSSVLGA